MGEQVTSAGLSTEQLATKAFSVERRIKANVKKTNEALWALAKDLYEFHEGGYWSLLGAESLNEWLASPEIGMKRSQFFRLTGAWRDLIVVKQIPESKVMSLDPSKVQEVVPAIRRGDVKPDDALDDAELLGVRDLRKKYRLDGDDAKRKKKLKEDLTQNGAEPEDEDDDSRDAATYAGDPDETPLRADLEPDRVQCPTCSSWVPKDELPEHEDEEE